MLPASCLILLMAGCALPRHSVVLFTLAPDLRLAKSLEPIPADWDHHLLRVNLQDGQGKKVDPLTGGDPTHHHDFGHQHTATSGPALETAQPGGLRNQGSNATHVHLLQSQTQSTGATGEASTIPPSVEFLAFTLKSSKRHVRPGVVVAFTGADVPPGWKLCDGSDGAPKLDDLYVILRAGQRSEAPVGEDDPRHDASHSHTWSVAPTDPANGQNRAFFGGLPGPQAGFSASSLTHPHDAAEPIPWHGVTEADATPPRPPTLAIRFIMAGPEARKMPPGALLPYVGDSAPPGWSIWRQWNGAKVEDRFLAGASATHLPGSTYGAPGHTHFVTMTHHIVLAPSTDTGTTVDAGTGPAMAIAAHTHQAETIDASGKPDRRETGTATSIPPFVSLLFIRKN